MYCFTFCREKLSFFTRHSGHSTVPNCPNAAPQTIKVPNEHRIVMMVNKNETQPSTSTSSSTTTCVTLGNSNLNIDNTTSTTDDDKFDYVIDRNFGVEV